MWTQRRTAAGLFLPFLLFLANPPAGAGQMPDEAVLAEQFRVGPLYSQGAGDLAVVVELPYGISSPDPSNFRLRFNEALEVRAFAVKTFLTSGNELAWLICVDTSGSMAGAPLRDAKTALHSLLSDRRSLRVGLMSFGSAISAPKFADTRQALTRTLDGLRAAGGKSQTRLYQALYEALDFYEEKTKAAALPARRRILVISDGKDEGSTASAESVIKRSLALGIPIDAVGRSRIPNQYTESLRHVAAGTGGRFVDARPELVSLTDALTRIYRELMETQTVVAYFRYRPNARDESTDRISLELQRPGGPALQGSVTGRIALPYAETAPTLEPSTKPAPTRKPQPQRTARWLTGGLLVLLAATAVFFGFRSRSSRVADRTNARKTPQVIPGGEPQKRLQPQADFLADVSPPSGRERRTVVGGCFPRPEPKHPAAFLVGVSGRMQGLRLPIEKETVRIGADAENDLVVADDAYVSGTHAFIRYENGSLFIHDQQSRNGTFVNGERVTDRAQILLAGDEIRVGRSTFQVAE